MDGIQGAVLEIKLRHIDKATEGRRTNAARYRKLLSDVEGIVLPVEGSDYKHVYHIFAVRVDDRDMLLKQMGEEGVGCAIHYPVPLHLQEAYSKLGYRKDSFPIAERCSAEFLSLPMFPELTREQVEMVVVNLKNQLVTS